MLSSFGGGRLLGSSFGQGRPWVLALHGWARTHRDFSAVLEGLDAIALDLPGFGAAAPPAEPWTTADYAQHLAPVLDDLGPGALVLGHSFGGRVAVHLAAAYPERIGALVLTGVPLIRSPSAGRRPPFAFRVGRAIHRMGLLDDRRIEAMRQRYGSADYRAATGVMRDVLVKAVNETYQPQLQAFPGPIELVWGSDDDQAPLAVAQAAMSFCAHPTLTVCEGAGHFVPLKDPDALRRVIERHHPRLGPRLSERE